MSDLHVEIGSPFMGVRLRTKGKTLESKKHTRATLLVDSGGVCLSVWDAPGTEPGACLAEVEIPIEALRSALAVWDVAHHEPEVQITQG
jgi:hypothetical protein